MTALAKQRDMALIVHPKLTRLIRRQGTHAVSEIQHDLIARSETCVVYMTTQDHAKNVPASLVLQLKGMLGATRLSSAFVLTRSHNPSDVHNERRRLLAHRKVFGAQPL